MYQVTGHLYHLQWQWATIKKIENASKEKKRVTLSFSLSRVKIGYYSICRSISRTYQLNGDVCVCVCVCVWGGGGGGGGGVKALNLNTPSCIQGKSRWKVYAISTLLKCAVPEFLLQLLLLL